MTDARTSAAAVEVLGVPDADARVAAADIEVLGAPDPEGFVAGIGLEILGQHTVEVLVTAAAVEVLGVRGVVALQGDAGGIGTATATIRVSRIESVTGNAGGELIATANAYDPADAVRVTAYAGGEGLATATIEVISSSDVNNSYGGLELGGPAISFWEPPVAPVPAPLQQVPGYAYDIALALSAPILNANYQPVYSVSTARRPRPRQRLVVGSKDVTFFRDKPTPIPTYLLTEPMTYGPTTLTFPQISAVFEKCGVGDLSWLRAGVNVLIQDVDEDDVVLGTRYRGVVVAFDISGPSLSVEVGGMLTGRAALRNRQPPMWRTVTDAGRRVWNSLNTMGLSFTPRIGPNTRVQVVSFGGMSELDYLEQICALAQNTDGTQWAITHNRASQFWEMTRKNLTTIHCTLYVDDARIKPDLRRDMAEEPNRIFMTGVTPEGLRVKNAVYPGLVQGPAPPFPGYMQMGSTGDGVTMLIWRLIVMGYLDLEVSDGGYDIDVKRAVKALQRDAGIEPSGEVGEPTWEALYDIGVTGASLTWSKPLPMAERSNVKAWFRTGSGSLLRRNPAYDPHELVRDLNVDVGTGFTKDQMREWAQAELNQSDNWVGSIDIGGYAAIRGEHNYGDPLTEDDVLPSRELVEGMNVWVPNFDGGTLFHISAITVDENGVSLTVDTRARDAMKIWQIIERNRESRTNPARDFAASARRSSTIQKDHGTFDEVGGMIFEGVDLKGGRWTKFPVIAGQAGTIASIRLALTPHREFAVVVCGRNFSDKRINQLIDHPLTHSEEPWYEKERVVDWAENVLMLYAAGTWDQPCGYYPRGKTNDEGNPTNAPLTGKHYDDAGFSYYTYKEPVLYVGVWVPNDTRIKPGRIMWPQISEGQ